MSRKIRLILFCISGVPLIFLAACSDPQNAPTAIQEKVAIHSKGWNVSTSPDFHGKILAAQQYKARECQPCHGNPNAADDNSLVNRSCRACHATYPHRQGWSEVSSPNFHGQALAAVQFNAASCQPCHGVEYDGGTSKISCRTCHTSYPHATGWVAAHSGFIKSNNYNLLSCQPCHGQDYGRKKIDNSCLTCHTKPGDPEACNTCHGNSSGDATDLKNAAPPRGLDGETNSTTPAVGAHQAHFVYFDKLPAATTCQECHALPQNFSTTGHIDTDGRAEAVFKGALVTVKTEGGARVPNVIYSATNNTCAGSYCHGNWALLKSQSKNDFIYIADKMEGLSASPKWTDSASAACGTCHGLPPTGHRPHDITVCNVCHPAVIDVNGKIIDKAKHLNGKVNVFDQEYPMF